MSECKHGTPLYTHCPDCHAALVCPTEPALSEDKPASPKAAARRVTLEKHLADEIARMRGDDAEITRLRAEIGRLKSALKPFAGFVDKASCRVTVTWRDGDYVSTYSGVLTPQHFAAAAAALHPKTPEQNGPET